MRSSISTTLAFLAAPVLPAIAGGLGTPVTSTVDTPIGLISTDPVSVFGLAAVFYVFALPISVALGIPIYLVLRRYDMVRWWTAGLSGAVVGAVGSLVVVIDRVLRTGSISQEVDAIVIYGSVGFLSGLLFWTIWRLGKPLPPNTSFERTREG